ncbi:caspase family protein [Kribbella sp. NBC_00709]|uniref:caspase, EACC1-associated type n=1 Tax=Kribbella sp. NBC_00709 TaxID=2975972 RepID=UPI002E28F0F5|nr:DnaJ C-terminal domain-containing protein [Kribbella sp. NBC_00709]
MSGTREALLIANGRYESPLLNQLRSPLADASELAEVLANPEIGWFTVERVVDEPAHRNSQAIERFFRDRQPDDLLLLHLSCHGVKDDDGTLYFAGSDTDLELLASTAVPASFLHRLLNRCRARSIVVLLDCCYSGAFFPGMKGPVTIDASDQLAGTGRVVLTASSRTEYSWESARMVDLEDAGPSVFTEAVVHGLRTGEADRDRDGQIGVDELYQHVYERLNRAGAKQTPRLWSELEYRVFVARSPRDARQTVEVPQQAQPIWPQRRARRGQDALIRLDFGLQEMLNGTKREVKVDTAMICDGCRGLGTASDSRVSRCPTCSGIGTRDDKDCEECTGFGTVIEEPCARCDGGGRVRVRRTLTVNVPSGVYEGTRIQLSSEGEVGPGGGPPGDLYIEVAEQTDENYRRSGIDLHRTSPLTISADLAATGGVVDLETPEGPKQLKIPRRSVSGQVLRIAGLGLPELGTPAKRGALLVELDVQR